MISSVRIRHFKGLRDFAMEDLARVTLVGGENAAGKTTLLESLFLFFDRTNPAMLLRQYQWRGMSNLVDTAQQMFAPAFTDYSMEEPLRIEVTRDGRQETLTLKFKPDLGVESVSVQEEISSRSDDTPSRQNGNTSRFGLEIIYDVSPPGDTQIAHLIVDTEKHQLRTEPVNNWHPEEARAVFMTTRRNTSANEDARRFADLDVRGAKQDVLDFMKEFDGRVRDLSIVPVGLTNVLHADIGLRVKVPVPYLGDGFSRLLSTYLAITSTKGGMLLIDEVASGLHFSILPKLWRLIYNAAEKWDSQVVATTHSYECIRAAIEGLGGLVTPDFAYARMQRTKEGTVANLLKYVDLRAAVEKGWEVR